jgi:TIR domain
MPVFISHSFENKAEFDNIADALEQKGIDYWKPGSLEAGSPLSDQLRQSIKEAELCVFVATRHSISSSWCGAELGAFWGAGKPVVIYVAEASLHESEMPKQFAGHLVERRIARVVDAVQARLARSQKPQEISHQLPQVSSMTVEELRLLIAEVVHKGQDAAFVQTTLYRLATLLQSGGWKAQELRELLTELIGVRETALREGAKGSNEWKYSFSFSTSTGDWAALAKSLAFHPDDRAPISFYRDCLVWRVGANQRVEMLALLEEVTDHDIRNIVVSLGTPILTVGRGSLGKLIIENV